MEKEMSQKDLAQKVNEKPSVIQDYEASRAIPNPQILGKLERIVGVKLRGMSAFPSPLVLYSSSAVFPGSEIGKKLEGPKKS